MEDTDMTEFSSSTLEAGEAAAALALAGLFGAGRSSPAAGRVGKEDMEDSLSENATSSTTLPALPLLGDTAQLASGSHGMVSGATAGPRTTGEGLMDVSTIQNEEDSTEVINAWRSSQIELKQAQLMSIVDRHDDHVRELFHLDRFVTLLGFDPSVAKADKSDVFLSFQNNYDLFTHAAPEIAGPEAGGRRTTRRSTTQRKDGLLASSNGAAVHTSPIATTPGSVIKRDVKGKGRAVEVKLEAGLERGAEAETVITLAKKASKPRKRPSTALAPQLLPDGSPAPATPIPRPRSQKKRPPQASPSASTSKLTQSYIPHLDPNAKRFKLSHDFITNGVLYTHADQVVPPPPFGGSLRKVLDSYIALDEEGDPPTPDLEARAVYEADILTQVSLLRKGGAKLFNPDRKIAVEPKRLKDHTDNLLDHVVYFSKLVHDERKSQIAASRRVGKMVLAHFDKERGKEERERKEGEKERKTLAKWTVREVRKKWKLAVNVVKMRRKARVQAEQERLGKEHLNAMLDKSTSMLQAQQVEMLNEEEEESEADSSEESGDETDESDEEEEEEEEEEGEEESAEEEEEGSVATEQDISAAPTPPKSTRRAALIRSSRASTSVSVASSRGSTAETEPEPEDDDAIFDAPDDLVRANEDDAFEAEMEDESEGDSNSELDGLAGDAEMSIEELMKQSGYGAMLQEQEGGADQEMTNGDASQDDQETLEVASLLTNGHSSAIAPISPLSSPAPKDELDAEEEEAMSEFGSISDGGAREVEDEQFEDMMDEDDEKSDDSEMDGLAEDAEMDIEELRKKYGMGREAEGDEEIKGGESDIEEKEEAEEEVEEEEEPEEVEEQETSVGGIVEKVNLRPPFLLRGSLRPYQQAGLEWLASLYASGVNGILADEMGLGKTIQTISLLAHLACDKGQWGPHLVVVPTSVMLNWEMEFKKFLPGFKIMTYYGTQKERKEKRRGWNTENAFHVCVTSYQLVLADQHIFRRKPWHYMILDEAHHIKNFRSQRWQTLLGFNARHRLLLTGTPLQNNLMELWSLLYFLMPHGLMQDGKGPFADHADFQSWFSNPMEKAIENGEAMDEETKATVSKLHTVLRPYLLRRLKAEVETQMPGKTESIVYCRLSKRQRFLYDDFMSRSQTRETLGSGHFLSIINCLMQLRKVCNHPDLFEVRPIVTSFAMSRSVASEYETKELLVRKRLLDEEPVSKMDWTSLTLLKPGREISVSTTASTTSIRLDPASKLASLHPAPPDFDRLSAPPKDTQTIAGSKKYHEWSEHMAAINRHEQMAIINTRRITHSVPFFGSELIHLLQTPSRENALLPAEALRFSQPSFESSSIIPTLVISNLARSEAADSLVTQFGFVTPKVKALDMPRHALSGLSLSQAQEFESIAPVSILQRASAKLSVAFPDRSLLQYDCGKLQKLDELLRECKAGGHRVLIFTQMTKVLDILEIFLSFHGHRYLRLDGSTKIEQRQIITERFNSNEKILCFISSTRSGGLGINLQGADTVIFYDSDWNPALDRQCQDRAHRIGQTREVRIWRFVTEHSIEENMLKKANQKRRLDEMVIAEGDFTTDYLQKLDWRDYLDEGQLKDLGVDELDTEAAAAGGGESAAEVRMALAAAEDEEDALAAKAAEGELEVDNSDFVEGGGGSATPTVQTVGTSVVGKIVGEVEAVVVEEEEGEADPLAGTVDGFMCRFVDENYELFD